MMAGRFYRPGPTWGLWHMQRQGEALTLCGRWINPHWRFDEDDHLGDREMCLVCAGSFRANPR